MTTKAEFTRELKNIATMDASVRDAAIKMCAEKFEVAEDVIRHQVDKITENLKYAKRTGNGHDKQAQPPKRLKTLTEFFDEYEPLNYVVEPLIDAGGLYTLTGRTGSCKTAFLILMSIALACARSDLLRNTIEPGRVAYLTCENPRNFRMRMKAAFGELGLNYKEYENDLLIQDWFGTPEDMVASLKLHEKDGPFKMIVIDTLASFFPGDNSNDNTQVMAFLRGVRPLAELNGSPAVILAAHPVKNAADDNLIPYGGGAILNEVDGNLTMHLESATRTTLHWQGKIRGVEFDPLTFELREITSTLVTDKRGNPIRLPFLECSDPLKDIENVQAEGDRKIQLLIEIRDNPDQTQKQLCDKMNLRKGTMSKWIKEFSSNKWVTKTVRDGYRITPKGKSEINSDHGGSDPDSEPL